MNQVHINGAKKGASTRKESGEDRDSITTI